MRDFLDMVVERFRRRKRVWVYRSSVTGKFVSREFADANPATTYRVEAIPRPRA